MTYNDVYVSESVVKSNTNSLPPIDVIVITAPLVVDDEVVRYTLLPDLYVVEVLILTLAIAEPISGIFI